jgi:hypothetical protein
MSGVNEGLGGINDFDVFLDETQNMIKIIDKNPLPSIDKVIALVNALYPGEQVYNNNKPYNIPSSTATFQLYGYKKLKQDDAEYAVAGFIKDFNLTTEISPDFAMMITAGAAAAGTVVGENNTALSKLNRGFSDRFKVAIDNDTTTFSDPTDATAIAKKGLELGRMIGDYFNFLYQLSNGTPGIPDIVQAESKDIENFKTTLPSLIQKSTELDKILKNDAQPTYTGTGYLPFNLNITLDGLSGIKINQQFLINTDFLPTNYYDTLRFLVKNLSHEISNNKWTTKIETYGVPKFEPGSKNNSVLITTKPEVKSVNKPRADAIDNSNGGGGNNNLTPSSVAVVQGSALRKAVVKWAMYYYNKGIFELYYSKNKQDLSFWYGPRNTKDKDVKSGKLTRASDFEAEMRSVGWNNNAWCNFFSKLVWKKAYEEVAQTDPSVANIKTSIFNDFSAHGCKISGAVQSTYNNMKKIGAVEDRVIGTTQLYPGDLVIYDWESDGHKDHIAVVVEADNVNGIFKTVGGNEGGNAPGVKFQSRSIKASYVKAFVRVVEPAGANANTNTTANTTNQGSIKVDLPSSTSVGQDNTVNSNGTITSNSTSNSKITPAPTPALYPVYVYNNSLAGVWIYKEAKDDADVLQRFNFGYVGQIHPSVGNTTGGFLYNNGTLDSLQIAYFDGGIDFFYKILSEDGLVGYVKKDDVRLSYTKEAGSSSNNSTDNLYGTGYYF